MFKVIGYRCALVETLHEYPTTGQVHVRIRKHDIVPFREIGWKSREIGSLQSHVDLRKHDWYDLIKRISALHSRSFLTIILFEDIIRNNFNELAVWISSQMISRIKTIVSHRSHLTNSSELHRLSISSKRNSNPDREFVITRYSSDYAKDESWEIFMLQSYLIFHYAREFVDAIRETEPMQFRHEVHGALRKAAHYCNVSSKENGKYIRGTL